MLYPKVQLQRNEQNLVHSAKALICTTFSPETNQYFFTVTMQEVRKRCGKGVEVNRDHIENLFKAIIQRLLKQMSSTTVLNMFLLFY